MRPQHPIDTGPDPGETRAEVARRRLAQLAASFEASTSPASGADEDADTPTTPHDRSSPRPVRRLAGAHVRVLVTIAVAAGVLLTWWLLAERPRTSDADPVSLGSTAPASASSGPADAASGGAPAPAGGEVVVDVEGHVEHPGIVTLPAGSRVHDAVEEAGGLSGKADTSALNLARVLTDGEQVLVGIDPPPGSTAGSGAGSGRISLGSATQEELETLPGIGPVTAQAILDWREEHRRFASVDDLLDVKGIGEATLDDLRDKVTP